MQPSQGLTEFAVRAAPKFGIVAGVAVVVTILWAIFGWSWFDVGLWPWALSAAPITVLMGVRLHHALLHRMRAESTWTEATAAAGAVVRAARLSGVEDGHASLLQAALWTAQARLTPGGVYSRLRVLLSEDDLTMVRQSDDPFEALLDAVAQRCGANASPVHNALDDLRMAVARSQNLAATSSPLAEITDLLALVLLASLPVGLVVLTGWWTLVACAAVALAYLALADLAAQLEDAFGLGGVRTVVPRLGNATPASTTAEDAT